MHPSMHLHNSCACAHKTVLTHANGILTHKAPNQACCRVYPSSTTRVQSSIDSRNSAIHKGYHTSLRPSSLSKPRHPSLKVVTEDASGSPLMKEQVQQTEGFKQTRQQTRSGRRSEPGLLPSSPYMGASISLSPSPPRASRPLIHSDSFGCVRMILPQVHLRKPCYDFSFL